MSYTLTETGLVLTETQDGVTMPADYSFAAVNDYVHGVDRYFEELQWLALGMASEIEKIQKQRDELLAALEGLHKVCEIGLSGKDGVQHTYFQTRAGHFVEATKAMRESEASIENVKGGAA